MRQTLAIRSHRSHVATSPLHSLDRPSPVVGRPSTLSAHTRGASPAPTPQAGRRGGHAAASAATRRWAGGGEPPPKPRLLPPQPKTRVANAGGSMPPPPPQSHSLWQRIAADTDGTGCAGTGGASPPHTPRFGAPTRVRRWRQRHCQQAGGGGGGGDRRPRPHPPRAKRWAANAAGAVVAAGRPSRPPH